MVHWVSLTMFGCVKRARKADAPVEESRADLIGNETWRNRLRTLKIHLLSGTTSQSVSACFVVGQLSN